MKGDKEKLTVTCYKLKPRQSRKDDHKKDKEEDYIPEGVWIICRVVVVIH